MLAKEGTLLCNRLLEKLVLHGITYIKTGDSGRRLQLDDSWLISPVTDSLEFQQFSVQYNGMLSAIQQELNSILAGGPVEESLILAAVSSLTKKALTTSNVLNFIRFIKQGDDATYSHCLNVALLCSIFGTWMGMSKDNLSKLIIAGMLHDIGKTQIMPEILYKPGKLSDIEFAEVKKHTIYGYKVLEGTSLPHAVKLASLLHHEKFDGAGYPFKIAETQLDMITSIVSICDIFEAMTADRVYRARMSPFLVTKQFERGDFGLLNPSYLLIFLMRMVDTFVGRFIRLNDGREGKVLLINKQDISRPLIQCEHEFIDLSVEKHLEISAVY